MVNRAGAGGTVRDFATRVAGRGETPYERVPPGRIASSPSPLANAATNRRCCPTPRMSTGAHVRDRQRQSGLRRRWTARPISTHVEDAVLAAAGSREKKRPRVRADDAEIPGALLCHSDVHLTCGGKQTIPTPVHGR